jgi:hypothetical protein
MSRVTCLVLTVALLALLPTAGALAGGDRKQDSVAPTAKALSTAKKHWGVFRARKKPADAVKGVPGMSRATRAKLESRRLATLGAYTAYAAVERGDLRLYLMGPVFGGNPGVIAGGPIARGLRFETGILLPTPEQGTVVTAILVADGARDARHVAADGTSTALAVTRNVILNRSAMGGRVEWTRSDGTQASYAVKGLPPLTVR